MNKKSNSFIDSLPASQLLDMMQDIPGIYLFAKDLKGRFTMVNATLIRALGLISQDQILGKTDYDFFDRELADRYRAEDAEAMEVGVLEGRIWLVPDLSGGFNWFLSHKRAVRNKRGQMIGIMGLMRDVKIAGATVSPYEDMTLVLDYILNHYNQRIEVKTLAELTHLSISQFERRFKKLFRITPMQHLNQVRIRMACTALLETDEGIALIAANAGFYDHSAFVKRFKTEMGVTPSMYRQQYQQSERREARGV